MGAPPNDPPAGALLIAGSLLGPYEIRRVLGVGGMGQVYEAFDARLNRGVAIKMAGERFSERFAREIRTVSSLNHPNICTVYDVGPDYLVMELVDGVTLRDSMRAPPRLDRSIRVARQVLEGLGAAHEAGIVHRDLKPENVMVRSDGYVKVLDFGLAKRLPSQTDRTALAVTEPGQILGTCAYMSPEQIHGREVDARSDLFSFGILLYELMTGRHPWRRASAVETMHAILHDALPRRDESSNVDAGCFAVVERLLRKHPADRYPSAAAALEALARAEIRALPSESSISLEPLSSIAVLPFVVLSDAAESRALSLGFADALITILGNLEDVRVSPTSAILNYTAGVDPERICQELEVRFILQGTVQKVATTWRVSIQLFDGIAQRITLAEKHDFTLDSAFDVQDEIGRVVVASLQSRFPSAPTRSRDRYSDDPDAYNDFMAGLRESSSDQPDKLRLAAEHLSSAVTRDPDFALAHAVLSFVSMNMHFQFDSQRVWLLQAEEHCRRALAIDPGLPEGHLARSWILWSPAKNFQHAEAIAALEQVLAARPNLERAHNRMSTICSHIGLLEESRIAHDHALRCNPQTRTGNLEIFYIYSGDFARAEVAAEAWYRERPANPYAQNTRLLPPLLSGNFEVAQQRLTEAMEQRPDDAALISTQGMLHAWRHETERALDCVRRSVESPRSFGHTHHTYYNIACTYAVLGDTEKALAWLERSVDTGFACWPFFRLDPHLASLQQEPAFTRLTANLEQTYTALKIQRL